MNTGYNIELVQNQSYCLNTTITDSNGIAVDLSNRVLRGGAKYYFSDNDYAINFNPQILNLSSGIISMSISGYQVSGLKTTVMPYSIYATTTGVSGNGNVIPILNGYVYVYPSF